MKKKTVRGMAVGLLVVLVCGSTLSVYADESDLTKIQNIDDLEEAIEDQIGAAVQSLEDQWEALAAEIDDYDKYVANADKISAFYDTVIEETNNIGIMVREDAVVYANLILTSDSSADDMYDDADNLYDCLYDDVCDDLYDDIYDGLLDDMYDYFYDGIIDDAYKDQPFDEWSDISSDEYTQWAKASSKVFKSISNTSSDVFNFCSDFSSKLFRSDIEGAESKVAKFSEKIEKIKSGEWGSSENEDMEAGNSDSSERGENKEG